MSPITTVLTNIVAVVLALVFRHFGVSFETGMLWIILLYASRSRE